MGRCRLPQTASLLLLFAAPSLLGQTPPATSPQTQVATARPHDPTASNAAAPDASAKGAPKESSGPSHVLFFYTAPRSTVEMEVHSVPATNEARLDRLRDAFHSADCGGPNMQEQPVADKHGSAGTNLICTWPGAPKGGTIVVAAHYEHDGKGDGALADWSGAALLPFLYQAIQGQSRANSFVFLESWKNEGVHAWFKSLSHEQRKHIRAMIDLDALGLGVTRYFTTFSFMETPPPAALHLQAQLLWAAIDDGLTKPPLETSPHHWLAVDGTDPFRAMMIPTIVIHSVPPESDRLPGSAEDLAAAVNGNAYFQTYHLICTYLASLDRRASKLDTDDPFWRLTPGQDAEPDDENPRVSFRQIGGVKKIH
jgi:Peptidase family M28